MIFEICLYYVCGCRLFMFYYYIVSRGISEFICSSADGFLAYFYLLAVKNHAALNILLHIS